MAAASVAGYAEGQSQREGTLQVEAEHDVEVVGRLVAVHADQIRLDDVHGAEDAVQVDTVESAIERGPRLLPSLTPALSDVAAAKLRSLGIDIRTDTAVAEVTAEHTLRPRQEQTDRADVVPELPALGGLGLRVVFALGHVATVHHAARLAVFFPSLATAFSVMAALEIGGRRRGGTGLLGWWRKLPVYEVFVDGAKEGFQTAIGLIPYLLAMLVAIGLLRASGVLDLVLDGVRYGVASAGGDTAFVDALPTGIMKMLSTESLVNPNGS